jgi:hypothetical protein
MSKYSIAPGVQISVDNVNWYSLTDHNRQPIAITYTLIEQADRMANGTFRKYIIGRKFVLKVDWKDVPTLDTNLVDWDGNTYGPAWIKAFYEANAFNPIWVRFNFARDHSYVGSSTIPDATTYQDSKTTGNLNSGQVYNAFMTTFTYDISKRMKPSQGNVGYDYVNLSIEFTEV